jgi:hypothetical protein
MFANAVSPTAIILGLSNYALADPTLGFGLNFTFDNGGVNTGIGVRAFSDDEQNEVAASVGLDYMFGSQSWRGSLGAAYMMDDSYIELNGGYDFGKGGFDLGVGGGFADTTDTATADTTDTATSVNECRDIDGDLCP